MPKLKTEDGKYKGVEYKNLSDSTKKILKDWNYVIEDNEVQERVEPDNLQTSEAGRSVRSESDGSAALNASPAGDKSEAESKAS